ncbi:hypothetical protein, partial [Neisseria meningitidis]|uniref:hypothetical protein n=1 Tax=Neisseria meningitidis TaxID=487 RepID=UPI003BF8C9D7
RKPVLGFRLSGGKGILQRSLFVLSAARRLVLIFVNSLSILPYKMPSESNRVQTAFLFQLFL